MNNGIKKESSYKSRKIKSIIIAREYKRETKMNQLF